MNQEADPRLESLYCACKILLVQDIACTATYVVFNLSHAVGNKQRIHCFNLLLSTANYPHSLT